MESLDIHFPRTKSRSTSSIIGCSARNSLCTTAVTRSLTSRRCVTTARILAKTQEVCRIPTFIDCVRKVKPKSLLKTVLTKWHWSADQHPTQFRFSFCSFYWVLCSALFHVHLDCIICALDFTTRAKESRWRTCVRYSTNGRRRHQ